MKRLVAAIHAILLVVNLVAHPVGTAHELCNEIVGVSDEAENMPPSEGKQFYIHHVVASHATLRSMVAGPFLAHPPQLDQLDPALQAFESRVQTADLDNEGKRARIAQLTAGRARERVLGAPPPEEREDHFDADNTAPSPTPG